MLPPTSVRRIAPRPLPVCLGADIGADSCVCSPCHRYTLRFQGCPPNFNTRKHVHQCYSFLWLTLSDGLRSSSVAPQLRCSPTVSFFAHCVCIIAKSVLDVDFRFHDGESTSEDDKKLLSRLSHWSQDRDGLNTPDRNTCFTHEGCSKRWTITWIVCTTQFDGGEGGEGGSGARDGV